MPGRSLRRIALIGVALVAATVTATACEPELVGNCTGTATLVCNEITVNGSARRFFTHKSAEVPPATGRPVVLFFHGDGGSGSANLASLYAQTDPAGAVVIQMEGLSHTWSFYMDGSHTDDVAFTRTVVEGLGTTVLPGLSVDPSRVYAVGSSRGGFMVNTLAVDVRTAGLFAATASLAGNFYCENGDAVCAARISGAGFHTTASVLSINGDNDTVVPPPGHLPSPVTGTVSWPWPMSHFAHAQGCSGTYAYSTQVTPAIGGKSTYAYVPQGGCAKDHRMVLLQGGGHGFGGWEPYVWSYLSSKSLAA